MDEECFIADGIIVCGPEVERSGDYVRIGFELDLSGLKVRSSRAALLTPHLTDGTDSLDLPSIGICGRERYWFYTRNSRRTAEKGTVPGGDRMEYYRQGHMPERISYSRMVRWPDRQHDGELELRLRTGEYGCCNLLLEESDVAVARMAGPENVNESTCPETAENPLPRTVQRSLRGTARIGYATDVARIDPDFGNNRAELERIRATIDSLKTLGTAADSVTGQSEITITRVFLKGFASPEGSYGHNAELARARTAALREWLQQEYQFGDGVIVTSSEPEDWDGLMDMLLSSDLPHRQEIVRMIDGDDGDPDAREWRIKSRYPDDYRRMVEEFYPDLRRTDYEIFYNVREYEVY